MTDELKKGLEKAMKLCSGRELCAYDIRSRLKRWGIAEEYFEKIIKQLREEKFIDDERFVRSFIKDKFHINGWGKEKIRYELSAKGLGEVLVSDCLSEIDEKEYLTLLESILLQKKGSIKANSAYELKGKLIRFAQGRGFAIADIMKILD